MSAHTEEHYLIDICNLIAKWTGQREVDIGATAQYIEAQYISYRDAAVFASHCRSLPEWQRAMGERGLLRESEATIRTHVPTLRPPDFEPWATAVDPFPAVVDMVNAPPHYARAGEHPSGAECIEIVDTLPFCLGNALKYVYRAGNKGCASQDYAKAEYYFNRQALHPVTLFYAHASRGFTRWAEADWLVDLALQALVSARSYDWRKADGELKAAALVCGDRAKAGK